MPEIAKRPVLTSTNISHPTLEFRNQGPMVDRDQNILPRVASGDPAAVSECLQRYGNLVWSLARRSLNDVQAAEDAVQDIFLKLWEVAGRFNPSIASETTFVAMIARRRLIDISRKRTLPTGEAVEFEGYRDPQMDVSSRVEINDEAARAAELLNQLPPDQRNVIKLSVYDGLSHARIAEATGLSLGTVKTHIRRGILKLRRALFPQADVYDDESNASSSEIRGEKT